MKFRRIELFSVGAGWPNYLWILECKNYWISLQICRWPDTPWFDFTYWEAGDLFVMKSLSLVLFQVDFCLEIEETGKKDVLEV